jgi:hypothetical protein
LEILEIGSRLLCGTGAAFRMEAIQESEEQMPHSREVKPHPRKPTKAQRVVAAFLSGKTPIGIWIETNVSPQDAIDIIRRELRKSMKGVR